MKELGRSAGGRRLTGLSRSRRLLALASQVLREEVMVGTQAETREGGRVRVMLDTWTNWTTNPSNQSTHSQEILRKQSPELREWF